MPRQAVVVGAGQGGLSAAVQLRLNGFDVLVLDRQPGAGGKARQIQHEGFRLDPGPSILIMTRLYEAAFRDAGRRMEDYLRFHRLDPFTRVHFEGTAPFDLPASEEGLRQLLREIAPEDSAAFWSLIQQIDRVAPIIDETVFRAPVEHVWQLAHPKLAKFAKSLGFGKSFKSAVDSRFSSPLLKAFFYGFPSYNGQTYAANSPGSFLIPHSMVRDGVWWPEGGIGAIPMAYERLARELGCEFRFGVDITSAELQVQRVKRVVSASGEPFDADVFVFNADRCQVATMLGDEEPKTPSFSYFTVHWGVRGASDAFGHHTLFVPSDYESGFERLYRDRLFPDRPIVYVNATHVGDSDSAPQGCMNLFAVVTSPAVDRATPWSESDRDQARERVMSELRTHGCGIDPSQVVFERVQTPTTFRDRDGSWRGSLYGPDTPERLWGLFPLRNRHSRLKNIAFCGGAVQPGAGLPMVTLSGRFAAEIVAKAL